MLNMLAGRSQADVDLLKNSFGHAIKSLEVKDNDLVVQFQDYPTLAFTDEGQSCCEHRYMECPDDLSQYVGATLLNMEIAPCDSPVDDTAYGEHDVEFLRLVTNLGTITVSNHNEHNGYYGGFSIRWRQLGDWLIG